METAVFIIAGFIVLGGAGGVILSRNPVHAALSLVASLFGVAVLFVAQEAHLLAAVQVIVYTGAIVVLILFVLMLLGVDEEEDVTTEPLTAQRPLAVLVGGLGLAAVAAVLLVPVVRSDDDGATVDNTVVTGARSASEPLYSEAVVVDESGQPVVDPETGLPETQPAGSTDPNIEQVGRSLFTQYVFAFEVTALLLTIAVVGAVVMARRIRDAQPLPGGPETERPETGKAAPV